MSGITAEDIQAAIEKTARLIEESSMTPDTMWISKRSLLVIRNQGNSMPDFINEILDDPTYPNHTLLQILR